MPGPARERLRNIMMATEHGTRSPEHLQIDLLQLVAELLIDIKAGLAQHHAARPNPHPAPGNGNGVATGYRPEGATRSGGFGL